MTTRPEPVVAAAILAAGSARRFGTNKLLQPLAGAPLLRRSLRAAKDAFADRVILVTGRDADHVAQAAAGFADRVVFNPDYLAGIGTSIAAAARTCRGYADALVVMLADQPLITADHLRTLAIRWGGRPDRIVASAYSDRVGAPALFGGGHFEALSRLAGDQGARAIIEANDQAVVTIAFEPASLDIDTPADLEAAARRLSTSQK